MKKISIEGKTRRLPDNFQNLKLIGKISKTLKVIESKKISTKLSESEKIFH